MSLHSEIKDWEFSRFSLAEGNITLIMFLLFGLSSDKETMSNGFKQSLRSADSVTVTWYMPEQWEELRATAKDPETIPATFAEWEANAVKRLKEIESEGKKKIEKVIVEIPALLDWLKREGLDNTTQNRAAYAAYHYNQMN